MLKKNLMPYFAKTISSDTMLRTKRKWHQIRQSLSGSKYQLDVYIAASDPYSYLLLQSLPALLEKYDLGINIYTIRDLQAEMFPDPQKWLAHSLKDAQRLGQLYELDCPFVASETRLSKQLIDTATLQLLATESQDDALMQMLNVLEQFWHGELEVSSTENLHSPRLDANQAKLQVAGHYLPAMVYFEGEWYWGLDRLDHLESRLNALQGKSGIIFNRTTHDYCKGPRAQERAHDSSTPLEMFFSARSPYSYIGLERASKLAEHYNVPFVIKPVMPMMMRGVFVPYTKKMYIFHDTKREAKKLGIPYGFVADPLGDAVKYCYGIYQYAQEQGKELEYLRSFGKAVNSQGVRADTEQGLRRIVEHAGLEWDKAKHYITNEEWKKFTRENVEEMYQLGFWGVPCFRYGDEAVWGQDRLWYIEKCIVSGQ